MQVHHTTLLGGVGVIIVLLGSLYFLVNKTLTSESATSRESEERVVVEDKEVVSVSEETTTPSEMTNVEEEKKEEIEKPEVPVVVKETPVATPVSEAPKGYTRSEVSLHGDVSSCWTIVNGSVYDLTEFVNKHPGGENKILRICGTDGTDAFMGKHGGESRPESTLAKYRIGTLISE